jgi:hypothetical protein
MIPKHLPRQTYYYIPAEGHGLGKESRNNSISLGMGLCSNHSYCGRKRKRSNILFAIMISDTLNHYYSLSTRDEVSHLYKTYNEDVNATSKGII